MENGFGNPSDVCSGKALAPISVEGRGFSLGAVKRPARKIEKLVFPFTEVAPVLHADGMDDVALCTNMWFPGFEFVRDSIVSCGTWGCRGPSD